MKVLQRALALNPNQEDKMRIKEKMKEIMSKKDEYFQNLFQQQLDNEARCLESDNIEEIESMLNEMTDLLEA